MKTFILITIIILICLLVIGIILVPILIINHVVFSRYDSKVSTLFEEYKYTKSKFYKKIVDDASYLLQSQKEEIRIKSHDNTCLAADLYNQSSKKIAILFHGYHSTPINCYHSLARDFLKRGYNVLLVHMRGHNKSKGNHNYFGQKEYLDVLAWQEYAKDYEEVIICGMSMGGYSVALAADKITNSNVKCLIIDSAFTNAYTYLKSKLVLYHTPRFIYEIGVKITGLIYHIDLNNSSLYALENTTIPCFFTHGGMDEVTSKDETIKAYDACISNKELMIANESAHVMGFSENEELVNCLFKFIESLN